MKGRTVWAIARKDLREVLGNPAVWAPIVILPVVFVVLLPLLMLLLPQLAPNMPMSGNSEALLNTLLSRLPAEEAAPIAQAPLRQRIGLLITGYLFAPLFLIVPLMVASLVGANAFVGEKERKTLEALLYSPATDAELLVGKALAAAVPALAIAWVSFGVYALVVNAAAWPVLQALWFPTPAWWPLIFWAAPALVVLGIEVAVLISARVNTFMAANQASGALVLVVLALMAGQASGLLFLSPLVGFAVGTVIWLVDAVLLRFAIRTFSRSRMITRI